MIDQELASLERRYGETGTDEDLIALTRAEIRAGMYENPRTRRLVPHDDRSLALCVPASRPDARLCVFPAFQHDGTLIAGPAIVEAIVVSRHEEPRVLMGVHVLSVAGTSYTLLAVILDGAYYVRMPALPPNARLVLALNYHAENIQRMIYLATENERPENVDEARERASPRPWDPAEETGEHEDREASLEAGEASR